MKSPALPLVVQLQGAIRACGLSLQELGRRTGVSQGQLSRFLRGDRTLTLPAAAKVCHYFGLELCRRAKSAENTQTGRSRGGTSTAHSSNA